MNDPVSEYIRERTGISIDREFMPDSGDSQNKVNVMIAANDLPDIVNNNGGMTQLINMIEADMVWPLEPLIESNGPDIKADNLAMAAVLQRKMASPDGELYIFPMNRGYWDSSAFGPQRGFFIRWDLYKELGYPQISNTSELVDVLIRMCELEPVDKNGQKTYGAAVWNNAFNDAAFLPQAIMMGMADGPNRMFKIDIETKEISDKNQLFEADSYIWESLKWCNKLAQAGYFDPDSYTQTYQNYMDKSSAGQYMMGALTWSNGGANNNFIEDGTPEKQMICLPSTMFGWTQMSLYENMVGGERGWVVSKNCKTPERAMDLFNFMSTMEFSRVAHNGVEGTNWSMVDGVATPNASYAALQGDGLSENMRLTGGRNYRLFTGYASATMNPGDNQPVDLRSAARSLTDTHRDFLDFFGAANMHDVYANGLTTHVRSTVVNWGVLPEELITYQTNLTEHLHTSWVDITLAKTDDEFYAEQAKFWASLAPYRVDEIFQIYYDNAMSRMGEVQPIYDLLAR